MVTSGKLKAEQLADLETSLAHDLRNYPMDLVENALREHKENSPFWPSLSDLMKHIKPRLDHRHRMERFQSREVWTPSTPHTKKEAGHFTSIAIAAGLQDEPQEVRTAAVSGWKDGGAKRLMDAGIEAERLRIGTKVTEKPVIDSKDQPWHEANELKASALRINAHDEALGRSACFRLSTLTKPSTEEMER